MTNIWHDADPVAQADASLHELASVIQALKAVTLTGIRVWSPSNAIDRTNRKGHVWAMDGTLLDTFAIADHLTLGWTSATLTSPISMLAGQILIIGYSSSGNYGATGAAFNTSYVSSDGAMCFPQSVAMATVSSSTPGNGKFNNSPGSYPDTAFNATFFGVDAVYTAGGGAAPTVTGVAAGATGLVASATISATDPDTLVGAMYALDWGDGNQSSGASGALTHTYSVGGSYPLLASVTDSSGLTGYRAAFLAVSAPISGLDVDSLIDPIVSHALATGLFERVNTHEPKNSPGNGLTYAVWANDLGPAQGQSSLINTSAVITLNGRIYTSMLQEPQDSIDPDMTKACSALIGAYSGDFDCGGAARNIDLLGELGTPLSAKAGYIEVSGKLYRCYTITIPIIVNDAWAQVA